MTPERRALGGGAAVGTWNGPGCPVQPGSPARRAFPGRHDQVSRARGFVAEVLGPVTVLDEATLLVSELCTNALQHSASGNSGTFEVAIYPGALSVRVEVRERARIGYPRLALLISRKRAAVASAW
jgi:hypothetical protein